MDVTSIASSAVAATQAGTLGNAVGLVMMKNDENTERYEASPIHPTGECPFLLCGLGVSAISALKEVQLRFQG
ncbi:MAG: hypothetical protein HY778_00380 [Betaproteobacteria bacterium]|nr:hypothetical protein [Betaproteobacteria bacterium]